MKKTLLAALAALAPLCAQTYVIQNATVMTVSKGTIKNGSIVVKDGKIAEVGEKVTIPPDAKIIDAKNQYVTPGIIDCHSHIGGDGGINEGSTSTSIRTFLPVSASSRATTWSLCVESNSRAAVTRAFTIPSRSSRSVS